MAHRMGRSVECYTWDVATQDFMINSSLAWGEWGDAAGGGPGISCCLLHG